MSYEWYKVTRKTIIQRPLISVWRKGSQNYVDNSDFNFYEVDKVNYISAIPEIVMKINYPLVFIHNKSLDLKLKY